MVPELGIDVLFQDDGALVIFCVWRVVGSAVGEYPLQVCNEEPLVAVVAGTEALMHGLQVHRVANMIIVVGNHSAVHRCQEGPGRLVVLHSSQDSLRREN